MRGIYHVLLAVSISIQPETANIKLLLGVDFVNLGFNLIHNSSANWMRKDKKGY